MAERQQEVLSELISTLKQQRDALAVKIHLGKAELREEWDVLDDKLSALLRDYEPLKKATSESAGDVWESLKLVGEEIKSGFDKIRRSL